MEKASREKYSASLAVAVAQRKQACHEWPPLVRPYPIDPGGESPITFVLKRWQGGRCAVCGGQHTLQVDHEHDTDAIRGYLCPGCNVREGKGGGPLFDAYRERPPAVILGLRGRYGTWRGDGGYWPDGHFVDPRWREEAAEARSAAEELRVRESAGAAMLLAQRTSAMMALIEAGDYEGARRAGRGEAPVSSTE